MARRSPFDPDILDMIQSLAVDTDWSATQIHRKVEDEFLGRDIPSQRAVQVWVKKYRPADPSGPWFMLDADPADAALILPVLAKVIVGSKGSRTITRAEGDMIVRVRKACPDMPEGGVWRIARMYRARETNNEPSDDLDALLAFAPWRDQATDWNAAVEAGWIRAVPGIRPPRTQGGNLVPAGTRARR